MKVKILNRIHTRRRNVAQRAAAWLWAACDRHQWLPLLIALVLLAIVNSPLVS